MKWSPFLDIEFKVNNWVPLPTNTSSSPLLLLPGLGEGGCSIQRIPSLDQQLLRQQQDKASTPGRHRDMLNFRKKLPSYNMRDVSEGDCVEGICATDKSEWSCISNCWI